MALQNIQPNTVQDLKGIGDHGNPQLKLPTSRPNMNLNKDFLSTNRQSDWANGQIFAMSI